MPLKNVRYRVKKMKGGKKVRLAFRKGSNKVVEAKTMKRQGGRLKAMMMAEGR